MIPILRALAVGMAIALLAACASPRSPSSESGTRSNEGISAVLRAGAVATARTLDPLGVPVPAPCGRRPAGGSILDGRRSVRTDADQ